MKHLFSGLLLLATALLLAPTTLHAQSGAFTYQGRVTVGGTNFTGTGQFKFALVTGSGGFLTARASATVFNGFIIGYTVTEPGSGYTAVPSVRIEDSTGSNAVAVAVLNGLGGITNLVIPINGNGFGYSANPRVTIDPPSGASVTTYWNHDGSDGTEPEEPLSLPVQDGLFTVVLGDPAAGTAPIAPEMFHVAGLRLRIWFNDGTNGWAALEPSHVLTAAPSASVARSLSWTNLIDVPASFQNGPTNVGAGLTLVSNTIGLASNAITATLLASNAVTAAALANGAIEPAALSAAVSQRLFWTLQGNALLGTNYAVSTNNGTVTTNELVFTNSFALGTIDRTPLHLQVNGQRAFRIEPSGGTPNLIGGHLSNSVLAGVVGAVIGGGGDVEGGTNSMVHRVEAKFSTVSGGRNHRIGTNSDFAAIGGGNLNRIGTQSQSATIGGGASNAVSDNSGNATIAGGGQNSIGTNSANSTVSGGQLNKIAAGSGTGVIAGGRDNNILTNTPFATIGGGKENSVHGNYATVPGGHQNLAGGHYSFAAGRRAKALHAGAFVWGDSSEGEVASTNANQVTVRASGGVRIFSTSGLTKGVFLPQGGDSWSQISDAAVKKNRVSVDGRETLEKLAAIPIDRWHYVWDDDSSTPNLGPMAQDFKHAFFPGRDDQSISTSEFDGVALSAIQGLNQKLEEKDAELKALRAEMEALKAQVREALAKP